MFRNLSIAAQILVDEIVANALGEGHEENIDELTRDFIELFKESPSRSFEETLGFFGELIAIRNSKSPEDAVKYWHSKFDNRYDFSNENRRLEVKITTGRQRHHHFSSNQLPASNGLHLEVLSMLTEAVESGLSNADLFQEIYNEISAPEARQKLRRSFVEFFRNDAKSAETLAFDAEMATSTSMAIPAKFVPIPEMNSGVISASWVSDLDSITKFGYKPEQLTFFELGNEPSND